MLALAATAGALYWAACVQTPPGPHSLASSIEPEIGDLELAMWQAYYEKRNADLFALLVQSLRRQYGYPWSTAVKNAFYFARAAARFGDRRDQYNELLPDLERGYAIIRDWTGAAFDEREVARAELAWWVARRVGGEGSPENVGRLLGKQYVALYAARGERVERAGLLRARAAALRDAGGSAADWPVIGRMLRESYLELSLGLKPETTTLR